LPPQLQFMVLTRAQNLPGPDGVLGDVSPTTDPTLICTALNTPAGCNESLDDIQNAHNTDTPSVDQSQTYTSHPSHQVCVRQFVPSTNPGPFNATNPAVISTGMLLGGLD